MYSNLKVFPLFALIVFLFISSAACTKEKNEAQEQTKTQVSAAAKEEPVTLGKILTIDKVSKSVTGKAVDFTWKDDGKTYSFSEFTKGKVVFLNFWATWCGPCKREIPDIIAIDKELKGKDFVIIGANVDNNGSVEQMTKLVTNFVKAKGITYMNFLVNVELTSAYGGINGIPATFIIDKQGKIVESLVGMRDKETFMTSIKRALK
jgi:thiol-disulfide isomerase/thioredoxin